MKIKQVWVPWHKWECQKNGMWRRAERNEFDQMLSVAIDFTGNAQLYGEQMQLVVFEWPNTMLNSLTNQSINQKAFVGHCAVCFKFGIPEHVTRAAWSQLSESQRFDANEAARIAIAKWRLWYISRGQYKIEFPEP